MEMEEKYIELFPGNWLFNAGIVGFLAVLQESDFQVESLLQKDGTLRGKIKWDKKEYKGFEIPFLIYQWFMLSGIEIKNDFDVKSDDPIKDIWGTLFNVFYRGFFNADSTKLYKSSKSGPATFKTFSDFTSSLFNYRDEGQICPFCLKPGNYSYKNSYSSEHFKELGGSDGTKGMPNSFWGNIKRSGGTKICDTCSFLMLNRHLAFTELSDRSKIFINAPSFKLMYELNMIINTSFKGSRINNKRQLLAMGVIEFAIKTKTLLGKWSSYNIEIVSIEKKMKDDGMFKDVIEYYSISHEATRLLTNKRIANTLNEIGEFKILNLLLDLKFTVIAEIAYRILKLSTKEILNKGDKKTIDDTLFLSQNKHNQTALRITANKLLKLYALIQDQIKIR